jgi:hypothetical protein
MTLAASTMVDQLDVLELRNAGGLPIDVHDEVGGGWFLPFQAKKPFLKNG